MNRRSFLASSRTVASASLFGRFGSARTAQIKGVGATFPRQVFGTWAEAGRGPTGIQMSYDPIGSIEGLAQCADRVVDFASTVAPVSVGRLREKSLMQFPSMVGPVVFTVNLPAWRANSSS